MIREMLARHNGKVVDSTTDEAYQFTTVEFATLPDREAFLTGLASGLLSSWERLEGSQARFDTLHDAAVTSELCELLAEALKKSDRMAQLRKTAARSVETKTAALADAQAKFSQQMAEYGVEYAFRHGASEISRMDAEVQMTSVFNMVVQHEAGSEKLAWVEVQRRAIQMLAADGGSSLFSRADEAARRAVARSWLESAIEQLSKQQLV